MKSLLFALALTTAQLANAAVSYYNQITLPSSASQVKLTDAQYDVVPTKTVVRPIPGCNPYGEASNTCEETIVLESVGVIRGNISYKDSMFTSDGNESSWTSVVFNLADFSAADVAQLQAVYPTWKHPFSNVGRDFAKNKLQLSAQTVKQTIQVVDMKKSRLCPVNNETGEKLNPSCQDQIVYKDSWTKVVLVTVTKK
jgi:hypothetical protein